MSELPTSDPQQPVPQRVSNRAPRDLLQLAANRMPLNPDFKPSPTPEDLLHTQRVLEQWAKTGWGD